jgi:hypothetical protein
VHFVPAEDGGGAMGLVVRKMRHESGMVGYLFGPRRFTDPNSVDLKFIRPEFCVLKGMMADNYLKEGR